jgi:Tol biopolymer transport system component
MKIHLAPLAATVLSALPFLLNCTDASAARNEHRPVCSADGSRLIYMMQTRQTNDDWELYMLDFDSQVHSRLTSHQGWDGYAVWAPDGNKIIFDREDSPGKQKRPWVMELEGRTIKPLGKYEGWVSVTDWSEDNRLLGFQELDGQRDLILLDVAGNIVEKITNTNDQDEHDAHFSPDARSIAYASGKVDGSETSLELIDLEDGSRTVLRTSIGRIHGISWSPDGEKIAFVDTPDGDNDDVNIFAYTTGDQSFRQVTDGPSRDHMPMFCVNSKTLFFTSYRGGEERIYRIDPDPRPLLKIERARN